MRLSAAGLDDFDLSGAHAGLGDHDIAYLRHIAACRPPSGGETTMFAEPSESMTTASA